MPRGLTRWIDAKERINRQRMRPLREIIPTDYGYLFPEVGIIPAVIKDIKRKSMFKVWLQFRTPLVYRMATPASDASPMASRSWKTLLETEWACSTKPDSKNGVLLSKMEEFLQSCLKQDGEAITILSDTPAVQWRGKPLDQLQDPDFEEILWEINELNFRFDFAAVDARVSTQRNRRERQMCLEKCFPGCENGGLMNAKVETANHGVASDTHRVRSDFLLAMRHVMKLWTGKLPPLIAAADHVRWLKPDIDQLETEIARLYTQTFYDHFQRAPAIPRKLSHVVPGYTPPPPARRMLNPRPLIAYDLSFLDLGEEQV